MKRSLWRQGIAMHRAYFGGDVSVFLFAITAMAAVVFGVFDMWSV